MKKKSPIAFDFILDYLTAASPIVKPMFGCHAVYLGDKIMIILRKKVPADTDNGVWIATDKPHHESLKKEFPAMRSIRIFGEAGSKWQLLPEESDDFESAALRLCELILKGDNRIGKIPVKKKKRAQ
jgi:hypothetical protein